MSKVDELLKDYHEFLGDIDFSEVRTKTTKRLASIVGLKLIDKAIQKNLKEYTDQFFFEYSLLPSSINPSTGRLLSFAGVRMVDPVFEQKVGKYVSKIINTLYPSSTKRVKDYSDGQKVDLLAKNWFHNPELFLFPTINNVKPHYIHGSISWPESDNAYLARIEGNTQSIFTSTDEVNLYFANLSYPRAIEEMLEASKTIIKDESKKGGKYPRQKLIKAYHDGARRLKAHYDRYFVNDAGGQYDFITFPILSTRNNVVNNYYCEFYRESLADNPDKHVAGMGHFFLYFRNTRKKALPPSVLVDLFLEINKVISHVALNYVYGTGITMLKNMRKVAVKAAIAQVMARNMSHNFGSHVLSNLIGTNTYEMVKDENMDPNSESRVESNIKYGYNSFYEDNQTKPVFGAKKEYNRQLPAFFQYLKSRMDYLNEVTFNVTTFVTSRLVREDLMKELDRVRILLNTISGVGDFRYSFHLLHNGERITKDNDFRAAFPADVLGCQAFYNILENIIRNTAKHAKVPERTEVIFTIEFKDEFNTPEFTGLTTSIPKLEDFYLVEISSSVLVEDIDTLVNDQKREINRSVLDGNNNLRNSSLGLLEMEASAAFLRQMDLTEIESDDYLVDNNNELFHEREGKKQLNILKPFAGDRHLSGKTDKDGNPIYSGKLGYRFFVQKPKDFLFVGEWTLAENEKEDKAIKDRLIDKGVMFRSQSDFLADLKSETSFPHPFVILDNVQDNLLPYQALLSIRQIRISTEDKQLLLGILKSEQSLNPRTFKKELDTAIWKMYGKQSSLPDPDKIEIETNIQGKVLNAHWVIFTTHPVMSDFQGLLNRDLNGYHLWRESVPSLRQGKLPEFGGLSATGKGKANTRYVTNVKKDPAVKLAIFEAYDHPVIIIDERVQRFAEENYEKQLPCWALHQSTNVFIPRRPAKDDQGRPIDPPVLETFPFSKEDVISLDPNDFTEDIKKALLYYIDRQLNKKGYHRPSILIHYGILERMFKGKPKEIQDQLEKWAMVADRVVVTSGRGAHSIELPDSVCFVNLSSVLYACNENRNKYLIYNLINQSRKKKP